ncbi:GtrA family protein [Desulfobacter postgatei]|jgi:putative flippase GtrA|uniref:GtrA family protein n=1 Tax=Desulfobacter postgatei TaxID=2293 RepID=UPI002A36A5EF|nr:GtrA family protein [Desulfobacter postgatei]MDX9963575.1 GtrA family protein [Desulfobacter postgatei]
MVVIGRNTFVKEIPYLRKLLDPSFSKFVIAGTLGFLIDGGLLIILMDLDWDISISRACSFLSAVSATFIINRTWTFETKGRRTLRLEYAYYFSTQLAGAGINLSVFFLFLYFYPKFQDFPLIPFAFGAGIAMIFNYLISKKFIFIHDP